MANDSLNKARKAKNDEFYTLYSDVAKELAHYQQHFKGRLYIVIVIILNGQHFGDIFILIFLPWA